MSNIVLIESMSASESNIITESISGDKNLYLSGIFMQAEIKNRNGRIYPLQEISNAVSVMNESIKEYGGIFGELDHPSDRLSINLDRVSHVITELYMDGNNVCGKMKVLDTPVGLIAKEIAKSGVRFGVSSRGSGSVNENSHVSNFACQTIDLVATPSANRAYPNSIYEGLDELKSGRKVLSLAEAVRNDPDAQKYLKESIEQFVSDLFNK
jgi:hypothetical protein